MDYFSLPFHGLYFFSISLIFLLFISPYICLFAKGKEKKKTEFMISSVVYLFIYLFSDCWYNRLDFSVISSTNGKKKRKKRR